MGDASRARVPAPLTWFFRLALGVVVFCAVRPAAAYPWLIKHGYGGCPVCHTDPLGGELLTPYGRAQGDLLLRMRYKKDKLSAQASSHEASGSSSFDSFDSFDEAPAVSGAEGKSDAKNSTDKAKSKETTEASDETEEADTGEDEEEEEQEADSEGGKKEKAEANAPAPAAEEDEEAASTSRFLWGLETPQWLLLGGSLRGMTVWKPEGGGAPRTFPMQMDLYGQMQFGAFRMGGSIGGARVPAGSPFARAAQVTANQGDDWNLISRTHWLGLDFAEAKYTVRAGRLNLPFGLRIPEHTSWVRQATRTDRESNQQHGVALAYNGDFLRGELMLIAGNYQVNPEIYRERGYSLYAEIPLSSTSALGLSSLVTVAEQDRWTTGKQVTRQAHGLVSRVSLSKDIVVMAEADALLYQSTILRYAGYVGFVQLDWEAVQGLHFMLTGEAQNRSGFLRIQGKCAQPCAEAFPDRGANQLGGWGTVNWFFLPHMDLRVDAVMRQEETLALFAQLHAFL